MNGLIKQTAKMPRRGEMAANLKLIPSEKIIKSEHPLEQRLDYELIDSDEWDALEDKKSNSEQTLDKDVDPPILKAQWIDNDSSVLSVALGASGEIALCGCEDSTLRLWDLKSEECLSTLQGHTERVQSVALNANCEIALSGSDDTTLRVWNLKNRECLKILTGHSDSVYSAALNDSGLIALSGSGDKTLRLWDIKTGDCIHTLKGHSDSVNGVALSKYGNLALSGSSDEMLRLWDLKHGECLWVLKAFGNGVTKVALSNNCEFALYGSHDGIGLLKLKKNADDIDQLETLTGHADTVWSIACCDNEEFALSGGEDKTLRLWNLKTGKCEQVLKYQAAIYSISTITLHNQLYALAGLANDKLDFRPVCKVGVKDKFKTPNDKITKKKIHIDKDQIYVSIPLIDEKEITFKESLGKGQFGSVCKATWRHIDVAVKKMLVAEPSLEETKSFEKELHLMAQLYHPNIVQFYGYYPKPQFSIVMEYMPMGSLFHVLKSEKPLNWDIRLRIATDMASGLSFLHQENIIHRDIKSLNVLLSENMRAKLTDFGMSKVKTESAPLSLNATGTYQWMAPEFATTDEGNSRASDMYSLGITFWEISARKLPFEKVAKPELIPFRASQGLRDEIPTDCPKKLSSLIKACWDTDPLKRPTADCVASYLQSKVDDFAKFILALKEKNEMNAKPEKSEKSMMNKMSEENKSAEPQKSNNNRKPNIIFSLKNKAGNKNVKDNEKSKSDGNKVNGKDDSLDAYLSDLNSSDLEMENSGIKKKNVKGR